MELPIPDAQNLVDLCIVLTSNLCFNLRKEPNTRQVEILKRYINAYGESMMKLGIMNVTGCIHAFIDTKSIIPTINFMSNDYKVYTSHTYCPREIFRQFVDEPWYEPICKLCERHEKLR